MEKYTEGITLLNQYLKNNPDHKALLCNKVEILEKMGHVNIANPLKEKLKELYFDNYKCGFFKQTSFGDIIGEPFV